MLTSETALYRYVIKTPSHIQESSYEKRTFLKTLRFLNSNILVNIITFVTDLGSRAEWRH